MAQIAKRTLKDGTTRWKAIVRRRGFPTRTRTLRTRPQAEAWAKRVEVEILDGRVPRSVGEERRTVDDVIREYERQVVPGYPPKDRAKRRLHLGWWSRRLGGVPLTAFRRSLVREGLRALKQGGGPAGRPVSVSTRNRYLATLRHAFTFALTDLEWIQTHPLSRMGLRESRGRVRFLDDDERARLLEACQESSDDRLYSVVVLAISTGARQGELMNLRWRDIDLDRGIAILHDTKNRERRSLPLEGEALRLLRERSVGRDPDESAFGGRRGAVTFPKTRWDEAVARAGIEDFRFHDLRHTAASYLAMSGATLAEIAEILGHKTLAMVKRYAHLSDRHTSRVVARPRGGLPKGYFLVPVESTSPGRAFRSIVAVPKGPSSTVSHCFEAARPKP